MELHVIFSHNFWKNYNIMKISSREIFYFKRVLHPQPKISMFYVLSQNYFDKKGVKTPFWNIIYA